MRNPFIIFFVFVSCSVMGQVTNKKQLTEADYHLWSTMEMQAVSAKGHWVSYHLAYESGNDTLFVRNKEATKTYPFAKGYDGRFAKDGSFACMMPDKVLSVLNLRTGVVRQLKEVTQYAFSADGTTLVTLTETHQLTIERLDGRGTETIDSVSGFFLNPTATGMVYTIAKEKASLHYCPFDGNREHFQKLESDGEATFENIVWQRKGASFGFVKSYKDTLDIRNGKNLYLYRLAENKLFGFDANSVPSIAKGSRIEAPLWTRFMISDDGQRVFFNLTEPSATNPDKPLVQIWNGNDAWTYSQNQLEGRWDLRPKCAVWWPDNGNFKLLTSNEQPKIMLSGDQNYAITYNPMGNQPQFSMRSKTNWYCTNFRTGKQTLVLENQFCEMDEITTSYGGKYLAYRNGENWWVYEFLSGQHINISKGISQMIYNVDSDRSGHKPAFGIAGWTANDNSVIVYDEFDLWSIDLKNLDAKRLTRGRERQIIFRLSFPLEQTDRSMNFDGFTFPLLDLKNKIYLKAYGKHTKQTGFYVWDNVEKPLVFKDKSITQLGFTSASDTYYYTEQDFAAPPAIIALGKFKNRSTVVVQSNLQHANYDWGKSQLISYVNSKNKKLQGALFYPVNYDSTKKYPMVVFIYEKLSQHLHNYINPTLHNNLGINTSNLNAQGYFVLYPDISFEINDVGISATDCVVSATKAVIAMGLIHPDKIALTGQSFGGYEADFIATQTNVFATVIAGASITDLVSHANSIGWNNGRPEFWRYENDQMRTSKSLFEDVELYLRNSPIMQAKNMNVPLLTWTGEEDRQVHYYQSIEFYNALRRLGKKQIMLVYPDNGHIISIGKSQEDFTHRFEQWLATYLKDVPAPEWIAKGMQ